MFPDGRESIVILLLALVLAWLWTMLFGVGP